MLIQGSSHRRAAELCKLLEERCPGIQIKLNPSKVSAAFCNVIAEPHQAVKWLCYSDDAIVAVQPRKGCFEIQDQTGKMYVSLLVS